jgi:hypothetical protein
VTVLPSVNVPLVGRDRRPTPALIGLFPDLSTDAVVVHESGVATRVFRDQLQAIGGVLPAANAAVVHPNGTPTRVLTAVLQRLP